MTQPRLDWDTPPQRVTMAPSAVQARRSGRQRVASSINTRMARYRVAITACPLTDHEAAGTLHTPLSCVNATRGDWKTWAEHHGLPCPVVAVERVRQDWGSGHPTTRVRWGWQ